MLGTTSHLLIDVQELRRGRETNSKRRMRRRSSRRNPSGVSGNQVQKAFQGGCNDCLASAGSRLHEHTLFSNTEANGALVGARSVGQQMRSLLRSRKNRKHV